MLIDSIQTMHTRASSRPPPGASGRCAKGARGAGRAGEVDRQTDDPDRATSRKQNDRRTRVLEHVVDTVPTSRATRRRAPRLLRAVKNRFGPTNEVGVFEMGERGLEGRREPVRRAARRAAEGRVGIVGAVDDRGHAAAAGRGAGAVHALPLAMPRPHDARPRHQPRRGADRDRRQARGPKLEHDLLSASLAASACRSRRPTSRSSRWRSARARKDTALPEGPGALFGEVRVWRGARRAARRDAVSRGAITASRAPSCPPRPPVKYARRTASARCRRRDGARL